MYAVPGGLNTGALGTFLACTNADTSSATIGVEVFGPAGGGALNNAALTAISVAPGATVLFGTGGAAGISIDSSIGPGLVSKGSARIRATSTRILCTAFAADKGNDPPISSWQLIIVAKTKQKAAN